jgi:RES domain-containing protein
VIRAWRIVTAKHAANAFDGEGARIAGGRWNSPGTAMVYASGTASLAVLEMLAHLRHATTLPAYVLIACDFDDALVNAVGKLPDDWRRFPAPAHVQAIGDTWANKSQSAVLRVPSAIVEKESNYLLNPAHPDFAKIKLHAPEPFTLDLRLVK